MKLESLKSEKFQELTSKGMNQIYGGGTSVRATTCYSNGTAKTDCEDFDVDKEVCVDQ